MERRHWRNLGGRGRQSAGLRRRPRVEGLEDRRLMAAGATITEFPTATASAQPQGIVAGPDGNLWFTETNVGKIGEITTAGVVTEFTVPTVNSLPVGISRGPAGDTTFLYFTESGANNIGQINTATGAITEFPIPTASANPQGIVAGPDGNLWFTESAGNNIGQLNPTTGAITEFPVPTTGAGPQGIAVGSDGNLYFTEANADNIGEITTAGVVTEFPVPTANALPQGITAGPAGDPDLYFTEAVGNSIGRFNPTTDVFTQFAIPTAAANPVGITAGPAGDPNLYFTESAADQIGRFNPTTGVFTEFSIPTPAAGPQGITVGPDGNLWFTEANVSQVAVFNLSQILIGTAVPVAADAGTAFTGTVATFTAPSLNLPANSYSATIDWGDGTAATAGTVAADATTAGLFDVTGTHTYAAAGTFTTTVTIQDPAGDVTVVTGTATVTSTVVPTGPSPSVLFVERFGIHRQPSLIVLGFNSPLDPVSAQNPRNYTLIGLGPRGQIDSADAIASGHATNEYEHILTATYNPTAQTVTLLVYEHLKAHRQYLLDVNGRPAHPTASGESPDGLSSPAGVFLSGNVTNLPGSDFLTFLPQPNHFFAAAQATPHAAAPHRAAVVKGPLFHARARRHA